MKTSAAFEALTGQPMLRWTEGPLGQVAPMFRQAWEAAEQQRLAEADQRANAHAEVTLEVLRRRLAETQRADLSQVVAPAIARIDAWRFVRDARRTAAHASDTGMAHMATYLQYLWQQDPQGVLTVADCARIQDQYARCYPKSAATGALNEAVQTLGALSLPLPAIARMASRIGGYTPEQRQASYEEVVRAHGLGGTSHEQVRARTFLRALAQAESPAGVPLPPDMPPHDEAGESVVELPSPNTGMPLTVEVGQATPPTPGAGEVMPIDQSVPVPPNGAAMTAAYAPFGWPGWRGAHTAQFQPAPALPGGDPNAPAPDGMQAPSPDPNGAPGAPMAPGQTGATVPDPSAADGQRVQVSLQAVPGVMDGPQPGDGQGDGGAPATMQTGMGAFASYAVVGGAVHDSEPLEVIQAHSIEAAIGHVGNRLGPNGAGARVLRRSPLVAYISLDKARGDGVRIAAVLPGRRLSELPARAKTAAEFLDAEGFVPPDVACSIADGVLSGEDDPDELAAGIAADLDAAPSAYGVEDMMGSEEGDASAKGDLDALIEETKAQVMEFFEGLKDEISKNGYRDPRVAAVKSTAGTTAKDVERALLRERTAVDRFGVAIAVRPDSQVEVRTGSAVQAWPMSQLDVAIADWQARVALRLPSPRALRAQAEGPRAFIAELPDVARARPELAHRIVATLAAVVPGTSGQVLPTGQLHIAVHSPDEPTMQRVQRVLADRFGVLTMVAAPVLNPLSQPAQHPPPVMQPDMRPDPQGNLPGADARTQHARDTQNVQSPGSTTPAQQPALGMTTTSARSTVDDLPGLHRVSYRGHDGYARTVDVEAASNDVAARLVLANMGAIQIVRVDPIASAPPAIYTQPPTPTRFGQIAGPPAIPGGSPGIPGLEGGGAAAPGAGGGAPGLPGMDPSMPMLGLDQIEITEQDRDLIRSGIMHYRATNHTIDEAISQFTKDYKSLMEKFGEPGSAGRQVLGGVLVSIAQTVYQQPAQVVATLKVTGGRVAFPTPGKIKPDHPSGVTPPRSLKDTEQNVPRAMEPRVVKPGSGGAAVKPPKPPLGKDSDNVDIGRFRAPKPKADGHVKFTGEGWGSETKLPGDTEQNVPRVMSPKVNGA